MQTDNCTNDVFKLTEDQKDLIAHFTYQRYKILEGNRLKSRKLDKKVIEQITKEISDYENYVQLELIKMKENELKEKENNN